METKSALTEILTHHRETIIDGWVEWVRRDTLYQALPLNEQREGTAVVYDALVTYFREGDEKALSTCLCQMAEKRFRSRFPLSSLIRAMDGFRHRATLLAHSSLPPDQFASAFELISCGVNFAQALYIDTYQQLVRERDALLMGQYRDSTKELTEERDKAQRAVSIKEQFLTNIRHELKTPLTIIQGFSSLLQSGDLSTENIALLSTKIHDAGELLLRMVNEIILLSRLESGEENLLLHPLYLHDLIIDILGQEAESKEGQKRVWVFDRSSDNPLIQGDAAKLKVMLAHILENAVKFSGAGSRIQITLHKDVSQVLIKISDEGIGVPLADSELIFEKFRQKMGDADRNFEGAGLGLALARLIARLHKGDIYLMEKEGLMEKEEEGSPQGSLFCISLPTTTL